MAIAQQRLAVRFVGSGSEYLRIWIVNLMLTIITLGLYYPFAKVRRLRYFHGATEVGGHALSFHGDPWKMLRGYVLVALLAGAYGVAVRVSPTMAIVALALMALIWPALWHSSLRFRLANTGWRGLRMRFTGSRGGAYKVIAPWFALAGIFIAVAPSAEAGTTPELSVWFGLVWVVALLAWPALFWLMKRYQHGHYALAGEATKFTLTLGRFYGTALRIAGVALVPIFVLGVVMGVGAGVARSVWKTGSHPSEFAAVAILVMALVALLAFVAFQVLLWPYLTSRLQNLYWNATSSQHLSFESRLAFRPLAWLTLKNWLLIIVTLGLYFPFARIALARLRLEAVTVLSSTDVDGFVNHAATIDESAAGDAAGDFFGIDLGL
jgi:uncharacterized membrane protein YjgN (DUF898 family)